MQDHFKHVGRPTLAPSLSSYDDVWGQSAAYTAPANERLLGYCHIPGKKDCYISVVDVASGNGRYALTFLRAGYGQVVASELSPVGCQQISSLAEGDERLTVKCESILDCDLTTKHDLVVCSGLLEEFAGHEDAQIQSVRNLQALTAEDGRIVLRYCLSISTIQPVQRVRQDLVRPLFDEAAWDIVLFASDDEPRSYPNGRGKESFIQTQTLVADRI